jgi:hypothetical protein
MTDAETGGRISLDSVVIVAQDQVSSDLADEKVILSIGSGKYFGLRGVGGRIWELIKEPHRVAEVRDIILSEYEVEPERCETDLLDLLEKLVDRGLAEIRGETTQ